MRYWFFANDHLAPLSVYQNVIIMCSIEFIFFSQNRASLHQRAQFLWDTKNQLADWRAYVHTSKMRGLNFQRDPWVSTNLCLVLKTSIIHYYRIILDKVVWGFFPWQVYTIKIIAKGFPMTQVCFFSIHILYFRSSNAPNDWMMHPKRKLESLCRSRLLWSCEEFHTRSSP